MTSRRTLGFNRPLDFNSDTVSSVVQALTDLGFTAGQVREANYALLTVSGGALRYRFDGGNPTTSVGHRIPDGEEREFPLPNLIYNLKMIAEGADVVVGVTLFI